MKFRPCIDIHNGKSKADCRGSLLDQGDQAVGKLCGRSGSRLFCKFV